MEDVCQVRIAKALPDRLVTSAFTLVTPVWDFVFNAIVVLHENTAVLVVPRVVNHNLG